MGASLDQDPACDIHECPYYADYAIYPDRFRRIEIAHYLCEPHHTEAKTLVVGREELYMVANRMIRASLEQKE